eukprot:XP_012809977.1 PREDICTED: uncharacterized protein LOC105945764 [Xenopus tropicalis]
MDIREDVVPAFARIKNSIRVVAEDVVAGDKKLSFVVNILLGEFGRVRKEEILAIQDYPKRGVFDITFIGEGILSSFLQILSANKEDDRLIGYRIFPHIAEETVLVVKSYSPFVPQREIELVLGKYCEKIVFAGKILNELGIWTSKFKFKAKFKKDVFPPARFRLGNVNLDCHFNGMPAFCRKCRAYGHVLEDCKSCTNCGESTHEVKDCVQAKKCFLCFQPNHLYLRCPLREKQEKRVEVSRQEPPVPFEPLVASPDLGDLSASPVLQTSSESLSDVSSHTSEMMPTVKRKKREKNKPLQVTQSGDVSAVEGEYETRGERLYQFWRTKTDKEIQDFLSTWSDEEELDGVNECIKEGGEIKIVRNKVLTFIRNLK